MQQCTTVVGDFDTGDGLHVVVVGFLRELSVLYVQFFGEPITTLKNEVYLEGRGVCENI